MRTGVRGTTWELVEAARRLRQDQTPAEEALWRALRGRQREGVKFRRQHAVGPFVLDFFCSEYKLVVEVDGGVHDDPQQQARDAERAAQLEAVGYTVLRFRNEQVLTDMPSVLAEILARCRKDA